MKPRYCRSLVLVFILALGCQSKPNEIRFILPKGYRGSFKIILDQPNGIKLQRTKGTYVFRIPSNGVLAIDGDPFKNFLEGASFADGQLIPLAENRKSNQELCVWSLGTKVTYDLQDKPVNALWWFVGTEREFRKTNKCLPRQKETTECWGE